MIYSLILQVATRLLIPLLLVFSVFMLLRGHSHPGGGFVGGLIAGSAFVLYAFSRGVGAARQVLRFEPQTLLGVGLACALGSGILALIQGEAFLTGLWADLYLPGGIHLYLGSTLIFDIGVFLVVIGTVVLMMFSVEERGPAVIPSRRNDTS
jgi:multicomponent Na+:H+ antiporter subunit B